MLAETIHWGDVPTWISAVASTTALVGAFMAVRASWNVLGIERERDRERAEAEHRAQANLVAAWTTVETRPDASQEALLRYQCRVHVANRSDLPIFNVVVRHMPSMTLGGVLEPMEQRIHSVGPSEETSRPIGLTEAHDAMGYPGKVVCLEFTDHRGTRWRRDENFLLSCVEENS